MPYAPPWSKTDDNYLLQNRNKLSYTQLAEDLNRSPHSVEQRWYLLRKRFTNTALQEFEVSALGEEVIRMLARHVVKKNITKARAIFIVKRLQRAQRSPTTMQQRRHWTVAEWVQELTA